MLSRRLFRLLTNAALFDEPIPRLCLAVSAHNVHTTCTVAPCSLPTHQIRHSASSSSTRWRARQFRDRFAREAKVQGLKSRAAFKLLEIDSKYKIFKKRDTVVDLGYAPGSWSQVAVTRTSPGGRVIGIDVLPVQPPKGVSTIQGNFLSPAIQEDVFAYVQDPERGRPKRQTFLRKDNESEENDGISEDDLEEMEKGYIDMERSAHLDTRNGDTLSQHNTESGTEHKKLSLTQRDEAQGRVVDVVLSDMSEPWDQTTGLWVKSVSNPYRRMQNTSGISFKDHAGSMVHVWPPFVSLSSD